MNIYRSMRSIGYQRDRKTIQRYRETLATRFDVCFLLCPTTDKRFWVQLARDSNQIVTFSC